MTYVAASERGLMRNNKAFGTVAQYAKACGGASRTFTGGGATVSGMLVMSPSGAAVKLVGIGLGVVL